MLLYVLAVLAGAALALVVFISQRPGDFRITRSETISAPAATVFDQVNDFRKWEAWSPWAKLDPTMQQTYEGPPAGTGAVYTWNGNGKVGAGKMTIADSQPPKLIRIDLQFLRPIAARNDTEFAFQPDGSNTRVTWTMTGKNGFMAKAFCLFMDMDKMVGKDFEKGLAQLKAASEAAY